MELIKNKIPASLHTYPIGGHGWGFHDSFPYKRQWTEELEQWLKEEYNKKQGVSKIDSIINLICHSTL